jgi:enolase
MILPVGAPNFTEGVRYGSEVYHALKSIINKKYGHSNINVGDEGGFAPDIKTEIEALNLIMEAFKKSGLEGKMKIAMDVAASELYDEKLHLYNLDFKNKRSANPQMLTG